MPNFSRHARFQIGDQRAQVGRRPGAGIVEQVGVVSGDVNVAAHHPLGAHFFEKVSGRHLAFANDARGHALGDAHRASSATSRFLKMLPAHFMVTGNFSLRTLRCHRDLAQFGGGIASFHHQLSSRR